MRLKKFILFIVASFIMTGCVEKEIIDDVNIETGVGYDLKENGNKIEGTIMVPIFNPDKTIGNFTFSATATSNRDLIQEVQRKSGQPLVAGSLQIAVFGENLAKNGILDFIDAFERDPSIGARVHLAVADGEAKNILSGTYGNRGNAIHLSQLIKHNTEIRNLPVTNLHRFLFARYQKGNDPYLPILKKIDPKTIDIVGIALFKEDKMVDSIPPEKMFYFKLLSDKFSEGNFKLKVGNEQASIRDLDSEHKFKLTKRKPYSITIEIKINGIIREYTGQVMTPAVIKKIEKEFETMVGQEAEAMIASFQEQGIDPIGFGHFIKTKTRGFDFKKWKDDYKNMTVHIYPDVTITEIGIIE